MALAWLKRVTPRSLYGRAALILLVPVVTIQLVVSVVFIQRHFEGVTRQMTGNLALGLGHLVAGVAETADEDTARRVIGTLATPLGLEIRLPVAPESGDRRLFYDLSGRVVIATLRSGVPGVDAIDLHDTRTVRLVVATPQGPMEIRFPRGRVSASNPHQLLVLMGVTSVLMTVIAYLFLRNQLRPIKRLAEAADAFGKGRLVPYKPGGAAEVRLAGTAFLDMRARLERQIEQRTLMLSGISHDLRTPLTRLKLGLALIDAGAEGEALLRDVDDMERLIDEFLAFARSDALDDPVLTDPEALVRKIVADAGRNGEPVRLAAVEGQGRAMLRPAAVTRAVENLIGNALRYAGCAEVTLAVTERAVRIGVEDDGPGIPASRREEAMRPFIRLDAARNQNRGTGVGLGLAIAQDIARRHGGMLRLGASERLGGLKAELVLAR